MASGEIEACQVTLRYANKSPRVFVVRGSVAKVQAQMDKAAKGSQRASMTDPRTGHRFTLEMHEAETYSVKPYKL